MSVLAADDPEWDAWLEGRAHDVYHLAGYHQFAAESTAGSPFMTVIGNRDRGMAWPYVLRDISGTDRTDVTSVYGYPGPIAWGVSRGDDFLSSAWTAVRAVWREQGAVTAFTRFNPILENADIVAQVCEARHPAHGPGLVLQGQTVSIDCSLDATSGYRRALRQEIAASRRLGLVTELDENWSDLAAFIRLYTATLDRRRADRSYYVTAEDVTRLRNLLGGHLHLFVTKLGDQVATAGLFTRLGSIAQAHLVGTDEGVAARSPFKVHLHDARRWAHHQGCSSLHLGGGFGAKEDSLFAFKKRFSPLRHQFYTGRWVLDDEANRALIQTSAAGGQTADDDFFPAYRRSQGPQGVPRSGAR